MPIYAYLCNDCGPFELYRPMSEFQQRAACPLCHAQASRMVTAARLNLMPGNRRAAHTHNEKNAHEPRIAHSSAGQHIDIHSHGDHSHTHRHAPHAGSRPWQVGH